MIDKDLQDVLLVSRAALEQSQIDDMLNSVLECLISIFNCELGAFELTRATTQELECRRLVPFGVSSEIAERYINYYHRLDPLHHGFPFSKPVLTIEEIIPLEQLLQTEYYNDFIRPLFVHHVMGIALCLGSTALGSVRLARSQKKGNFTSQEKAKAEFMIPHVVGALGKYLLLEQANVRTRVFESVCNELPHKGIIILDEFLEVVHMDEKARRIFSYLPHTVKTRSKIHFLQEEIYRRCEELLNSARNNYYEHQEDRFHLDVGQKNSATILLRLIREGGKPTFLICVEPGDFESTLKDRMEKAGLSPREQEVATLIYEGLKGREISDKLHISRYTVENHMRSIYDKLEVSNRTGLVHKLIAFE